MYLERQKEAIMRSMKLDPKYDYRTTITPPFDPSNTTLVETQYTPRAR